MLMFISEVKCFYCHLPSFSEMSIVTFLANVCRRRTVVNSSLLDTKLKRSLGIFDLIGLGKPNLTKRLFVFILVLCHFLKK